MKLRRRVESVAARNGGGVVRSGNQRSGGAFFAASRRRGYPGREGVVDEAAGDNGRGGAAIPASAGFPNDRPKGKSAGEVMVVAGQIVESISRRIARPARHARRKVSPCQCCPRACRERRKFSRAGISQLRLLLKILYALKIAPQFPSVPPQPPRKTFIEMLRTRGLNSPLTMTPERSAGHFVSSDSSRRATTSDFS